MNLVSLCSGPKKKRNSLQSELLFVGAGLKPLKKKIVARARGTATVLPSRGKGTTGTTGSRLSRFIQVNSVT